MKSIIAAGLFILFAGISARAQNADPFLSISTNPGVVPAGMNSNLQITTGNGGNDNIVMNSLEITVSVPNNSEIIGIAAGSDPRWTLFTLIPGPGGTIKLRNTGLVSFGPFDLNPINVTIKGLSQSSAQTISGNISYLPGPNPALGGLPNTSQGNANQVNDNSFTSLAVTASNCSNLETLYIDLDGDGYGTGSSILSCPQPGFVNVNGDCNDNNAAIHPNATETCDGMDNNCNGSVDENCTYGNANPYINIGTIPATINVGSNSTVQITAGNNGPDNIVMNSMEIVISVGSNASILGIGPGSDTRWTQTSLIGGPGGLIVIRNTAGGFNAFDLGIINITIAGVAIGGPSNINSQIRYVPGVNPLLGKLNSYQGNTSVYDDNSTSSLTVTTNLANPSINTGGGFIPYVGSITTVQIFAGNGGANNIVANSLEVNIVAPAGAEIFGIAPGTDPRWVQYAYQPGPGGYIKFRNTGEGFSAFNMGVINLTFRGLMAGFQPLTASIAYINASNPLLNGALNSTQGNSILADDNTYASINVLTWYCDLQLLYYDGDGDGYGSTLSIVTCPMSNYVSISGDCDDTRANVHPGAIETCDGLDNNCNGIVDDVSSFVMLAQEEIHLHKNTVTGNLGIWQAGKIVRAHENTIINGIITAPVVDFDASSTLNGSITNGTLTAPSNASFKYNTNADPAFDITIPDNYSGTYELYGNSFRKITVGKNATARFNAPGNIYIKELITKDADLNKRTTISFASNANLIIRRKFDLGKRSDLNLLPENFVQIYVEEDDVHIGGSSRVMASIDVRFRNLLVEEALENNPSFLIGSFVAKKIDSRKWVEWYQPCAVMPRGVQEQEKGISPVTALEITVMPNPSNTQFVVQVNASSDLPFSLKIFDVSGRLVEQSANHHVNQKIIAGAQLPKGTYFAEIKQGSDSKTIKLIKL